MIEQKYSTFAPRFAAGFIDGVILWPIGWLFSFADTHSTSLFVHLTIYLLSSSFALVYSIWMHGKYGQTLGKMACKVIVLDVSEQPLRMMQAVRRDILGVILLPVCLARDIPRLIHGMDIYAPGNMTSFDWMIMYSSLGWFALELITMFTNNKRRALHDFIAGSVVIRKPVAQPVPAAVTV